MKKDEIVVLSNCVYRFINKYEEIIYIGKATNLAQRLDYHRTSGHLEAECYEQVERVEFISFNSKDEMDLAERYFIPKIKPQYNDMMKNKKIGYSWSELDSKEWSLYKKNNKIFTFRKEKLLLDSKASYIQILDGVDWFTEEEEILEKYGISINDVIRSCNDKYELLVDKDGVLRKFLHGDDFSKLTTTDLHRINNNRNWKVVEIKYNNGDIRFYKGVQGAVYSTGIYNISECARGIEGIDAELEIEYIKIKDEKNKSFIRNKKLSKKRVVVEFFSGEVKTYYSIVEAGKEIGFLSVNDAISGRIPIPYKYSIKAIYKEGEENLSYVSSRREKPRIVVEYEDGYVEYLNKQSDLGLSGWGILNGKVAIPKKWKATKVYYEGMENKSVTSYKDIVA